MLCKFVWLSPDDRESFFIHTPKSKVFMTYFWPTLAVASSERLRSSRTSELSVIGWWIANLKPLTFTRVGPKFPGGRWSSVYNQGTRVLSLALRPVCCRRLYLCYRIFPTRCKVLDCRLSWGVDLQASLRRLVNHRQCANVRILKLRVDLLDHDIFGAANNVRTMYATGCVVQVVPFTLKDNVTFSLHNLGS